MLAGSPWMTNDHDYRLDHRWQYDTSQAATNCWERRLLEQPSRPREYLEVSYQLGRAPRWLYYSGDTEVAAHKGKLGRKTGIRIEQQEVEVAIAVF